MAVAAQAPEVHVIGRPRFVVTSSGLVGRAVAALALALVVFTIPLLTTSVWDNIVSLAAIYGIIGLSVNVITGYAGQISLGHQAFVGIGAFMSAFVVQHKFGFVAAVVAASAIGAVMALALGLVALRIRGLYMALVTLAFGVMAQDTIFNWRSFTGGGAGSEAPRPAQFASNESFAYLCLIALALMVMVDWRLSKSKAGRAIVAVRSNERVAATLGINTTGYKLFAFAVGGFMAGLAGSLFAHHEKFVYANNFDLFTAALPWVIMAVVGGLGSRAGVVIASSFFATFSYFFPSAKPWTVPFIGSVGAQQLPPLIGAVLLLFTITVYQGGLGQQILPYRRWLAGGRFLEHREEALGIPGQVLLVGFMVPFAFHLPWQFCLFVGALGAVAAGAGIRAHVLTRPELQRRRATVAELEAEQEEVEHETLGHLPSSIGPRPRRASDEPTLPMPAVPAHAASGAVATADAAQAVEDSDAEHAPTTRIPAVTDDQGETEVPSAGDPSERPRRELGAFRRKRGRT